MSINTKPHAALQESVLQPPARIVIVAPLLHKVPSCLSFFSLSLSLAWCFSPLNQGASCARLRPALHIHIQRRRGLKRIEDFSSIDYNIYNSVYTQPISHPPSQSVTSFLSLSLSLLTLFTPDESVSSTHAVRCLLSRRTPESVMPDVLAWRASREPTYETLARALARELAHNTISRVHSLHSRLALSVHICTHIRLCTYIYIYTNISVLYLPTYTYVYLPVGRSFPLMG